MDFSSLADWTHTVNVAEMQCDSFCRGLVSIANRGSVETDSYRTSSIKRDYCCGAFIIFYFFVLSTHCMVNIKTVDEASEHIPV
eukprot:1191069-Prorocentrum_minimum.AAC.3